MKNNTPVTGVINGALDAVSIWIYIIIAIWILLALISIVGLFLENIFFVLISIFLAYIIRYTIKDIKNKKTENNVNIKHIYSKVWTSILTLLLLIIIFSISIVWLNQDVKDWQYQVQKAKNNNEIYIYEYLEKYLKQAKFERNINIIYATFGAITCIYSTVVEINLIRDEKKKQISD